MSEPQESLIILDAFVQKLIEEKGLGRLEPEVKKELHTMIRDRVEKTIYASIVEALTPDQRDQFEVMLEKNASGDEAEGFLTSCIPDYSNFIAGVLLSFRRIYLG